MTRSYDSPVRRQAMVETRERIVAAGVEVVRELRSWDWAELTFQAVADRAGVGRRTVFRHFPTERDLHAAVMAGLARDSDVDYARLTLADVAETAARVFRSFESLAPRPAVDVPVDPTFVEVDRERREALLRAVGEARPDLSDVERRRLAAALDVVWNIPSYERLVHQWELDPDQASAVVAWVVDVLAGS